MTAPDMVQVIAIALHWHDVGINPQGPNVYVCTCGESLDHLDNIEEHQAAVILQALTEAGTVEWATQGKNMRWIFDTKGEADKETARFPDCRTTVSRLTLPWTAVE